MNDRPNRPVQIRTFAPEDQERLLEETILQRAGPTAAGNAIYQSWTGVGVCRRGLDPETNV